MLTVELHELHRLLSQGSEEERAEALGILAAQNDEVSLAILVGHISAENSAYIRRKLITVLGAKRSKRTAILVAPLLEADLACVRGAAREILIYQKDMSLDVLTEMMKSPLRDTRKQVVDVLAEIPGNRAFELLIISLFDPDSVVVSGCADALRQRRDGRAVPYLIKRLGNLPETWVGFAVIEALAAFEDAENLQAITNYLNKIKMPGDREILAGAWADAAGRAGFVEALPMALTLYRDMALPAEALVGLIVRLSKVSPTIGQNVPILADIIREELKTGGDEALWNAAELAAGLCRDAIWPELPRLTALITTGEEVDPAIDKIERLAGILRKAQVTPQELGDFFQSGNKTLMEIAFSIAEASQTAIGLEALRKVYSDTDAATAIRAVRLADRSGDAAADFYLDIMNEEKTDEIVLAVLEGVGNLSINKAVPILLKAIIHPSATVREAAVELIISASVPGIQQVLSDKLIREYNYAWPEILAVLTSTGWQNTETYWQQLAIIEDALVRTNLARFSVYIPDEAAFIKILKTLANDPDTGVRRMAIASLSARGGKKAGELLTYLYENDPERRHRYLILSSADILSFPNALRWLRDNLTEDDPLLQAAAIRALSNAGSEGAKVLAEAIAACPENLRLQEMMEDI